MSALMLWSRFLDASLSLSSASFYSFHRLLTASPSVLLPSHLTRPYHHSVIPSSCKNALPVALHLSLCNARNNAVLMVCITCSGGKGSANPRGENRGGCTMVGGLLRWAHRAHAGTATVRSLMSLCHSRSRARRSPGALLTTWTLQSSSKLEGARCRIGLCLSRMLPNANPNQARIMPLRGRIMPRT